MVDVSVVMITYNHELYIKEAILGVLAQITNFHIGLIIVDDFSTDKTEAVVREIINTHPKSNIINYTRHVTNKGMMPNFIWALEQHKGKYIALCEGDDYWTDPYKLQKQVDFLEANSEFVGCFHDSLLVDANNRVLRTSHFKPAKCVISQKDALMMGSAYPTASLVFRAVCVKNIPKWFTKMASDHALDLLITDFGNLYFMDENMSSYRLHAGGVYQGENELGKTLISLHRWKLIYSIDRFRRLCSDEIRFEINSLSKIVCNEYLKKKDIKRLKYFYIFIMSSPNKSIKYIIANFKEMVFPDLYHRYLKLFRNVK